MQTKTSESEFRVPRESTMHKPRTERFRYAVGASMHRLNEISLSAALAY
jgi:hypothetical protein